MPIGGTAAGQLYLRGDGTCVLANLHLPDFNDTAIVLIELIAAFTSSTGFRSYVNPKKANKNNAT